MKKQNNKNQLKKLVVKKGLPKIAPLSVINKKNNPGLSKFPHDFF